MDNKMFCFQCEQTARCSGCTSSVGVCGKSSKTAELQDNLVGDLIALALTVNQGKDLEDNISDEVIKTVLEGLFTTITNVNFNDETLEIKIEKVTSHILAI